MPVVTALLIIGMMLMLSPKNGLKAQNYNKVWTSTADFNTGTNSNIDTASDQAKLATTTNASYNEGFTNATYKDAATDANWDTSAHSLALPGDPANGISTDLQAKWKSATGATEDIAATTVDTVNGVIYIGGANGSFSAYKISTSTVYNLTSKILADWSTNSFYALAIDTTNSVLYMAGNTAKIGAYTLNATPSSGTWTYLNSKITSDWSTVPVNALTFDPINNFMYVGGGTVRFGALAVNATPSSDTWVYLNSLISGSWGSSSVWSLVLDSVNHFIYIGGTGGGQCGAITATSNPAAASFTSLTSKMAVFGANGIRTMTFDSLNGIVYLAGDTTSVEAFNGGAVPANGTVTHLQNLLWYNGWGLNYIYSITYDAANQAIYFAGNAGRFAAITAMANPANDAISYLNSKITSDWGANNVTKLTFNSADGLVYLAGVGGRFGSYSGTANPANGTWTNMASNVAGGLVGYSITASAYDSTNGFLYLGGVSGQFMAYKISDGTVVGLTSKISSNWGVQPMRVIVFDSINGKIYLCGDSGKFGVFTGGSDPANGTWVYLYSKISADWSTDIIIAMTFDSTNGKVYLGGYTGGKFGCFTGGSDPANGTWVYLYSKISADWSTTGMRDLTFDSTNGKIYLGGDSGKFGVFTGGSDPANGTWNYLYSNISSINGANAINTMVYVSSVATVYLVAAAGKFTSFMIGYTSNKNGLSSKINSTAQTIFKATLTATATVPANTAITYYLSNDGGSNWYAVTSGAEYTFATATSDLRWKANLTTTDLSVTPSITAIALSYKYFTSNTGTMSLVYDATSAVTPTLLSWNDTLPANTAMTVKIRSAATQGGLAAATWSDSKNAADTPVNLKTINVGGVTGVPENQFSEVYITLTTSDGLASPVLSDITEQYVINQAPQIQSLTASQATDGTKTVNIAYQLKDPDTSSNPYNQDQVAATFQYSIDSGSSWVNCSTITNSGLQAVNSNGSWTSKTAVWGAGTDLANSYYNGTVKIRVNANDNEQAHNTASLDSSAFSLDTKNPVPTAVTGGVGININSGASWTNSATVALSLLASDDSAKYMEIRNDSSFVNSQEAYSISKSNYSLSAGDGNKTVYVRFYDDFGNYADANYNILLDATPPNVPQNFTIFDTSDQSAGTFSGLIDKKCWYFTSFS